jgi:hypothetical protein
MAGADIKDAQAQLRYSRASTTLDIYQQSIPESQREAIEKPRGYNNAHTSRSVQFGCGPPATTGAVWVLRNHRSTSLVDVIRTHVQPVSVHTR